MEVEIALGTGEFKEADAAETTFALSQVTELVANATHAWSPLGENPGGAQGFVEEARAQRDIVDAERRSAEVRAKSTLYELHLHLLQAVREADTFEVWVDARTMNGMPIITRMYLNGQLFQ